MSTPNLGIVNANKRTVQDAASMLPNMRGTMTGWFRPLALAKVVKTQIEFETKEVEMPLNTYGMVQPMGARRLSIKPEGQRAWEWKLIHCTPDLVLAVDDVIVYNGVKYRVMAQTSYIEYGAMEYEIVNDYIRSRSI